MKKKLFLLSFILLITLPFFLAIKDSPVQSYTDFFIRGGHHATESYYSWSSENFGSNHSGDVWRLVPFSLFYFLFTNVLKLSSGISQLIICGSLFLIGFFSYIKVVPRLLEDFNLNSVAIKLSAFFYVFNTYTLTQFGNSFLLVIPYLILPLQILLLLKAFETKRYLKFTVFLAIINAVCFGINLIFNVISFLVLTAVAIIKLNKRARVRPKLLLGFFLTSYALTLMLCSFWILPQVFSSLTDPTTTHYVLNSEQFYNSDSSALHVLRGLGEWGFFGSQNGIPYNNFATTFKLNPLVIIAGYLFPFLAISAVFFYQQNRKLHKQIVWLIVALALIFIIIIGTYPSFPTSSVMGQAFKRIPFAMAFRNTYKFASIEMLLICLLLTISLSGISNNWISKKKWLLRLGGITVAAFICINAFPFFTNQIYSKSIQINKIPPYWQSTASFINTQPNSGSNSVFMLPNQYFEALRWDGTLKAFSRNLEETLFRPNVVHNSCKGCGQYLTSNFLEYTYNNLSSPGIFKLLGLTGNSLVIQRNDFDSKYYNVQTPEEVKSLLVSQKDVEKTKTIGALDTYKINKNEVNPLFYSPRKIIATNSLNSFSAIANQNDRSASLILSNTLGTKDTYTTPHSNYYQPLFRSNNTLIDTSKATSDVKTPRKDSFKLTNSTTTANYRVSYTSVDGNYTLNLRRLVNPISINGRQVTDATNGTIDLKLGDYGTSPIVVEIQQHSLLLKPNKSNNELGNFAFNPNDSSAKVYSTRSLGPNLAMNGSLEAGTWQPKVGNCAQTTPNAQINMKLQKGGASDGTSSLLLYAKDDSACTYTPPLSNFHSGTYYFSFDAKRVRGSNPSYCVWNGKECVTYSKVNGKSEWTSHAQAVYLNSNASNFYLYLYAQKANYVESQAQYDNVKIYSLSQPIKTIRYALPAGNSKIDTVRLNSGKQSFQTNLTLSPNNLIDNGSFKDGPWQSKAQNCTDKTGTSTLGMKVVKDSVVGAALKLSTSGLITACTNSAYANNYTKGGIYLATFKYRVLNGKTAKVCIWNGRTCIASKDFTPKDHTWHSASELVVTDKGYQPLSVYLYAPEGTASDILYTDISMRQIENSFVNSYSLSNDTLHEIAPAKLSFKEIDPTRYELDVATTDPSLVTFSQSYHPDWKAYVVKSTPKTLLQKLKWNVGLWKRYSIPNSQHIVANGYANGWWIDPVHIPSSFQASTGRYHMIIDYSPQSLVNMGLVVSGVTLVGCVGYLVRSYLPKRRHFKGWRYVGRR